MAVVRIEQDLHAVSVLGVETVKGPASSSSDGDYSFYFGIVPPLPSIENELEDLAIGFGGSRKKEIMEGVFGLSIGEVRATSLGQRMVRSNTPDVADGSRETAWGTVVKMECKIRPAEVTPADETSMQEIEANQKLDLGGHAGTIAARMAVAVEDAANRFADPEARARHAERLGWKLVGVTPPESR